MKKYIAIHNDTGKFAILTIVDNGVGTDTAAAKHNVKVIRELREGEIPKSREFRDAWAYDKKNDCVGYDCEIVRNMLLDKVRLARAGAFNYLNSLFIEELTSSSDGKRMEAISAKLKDLRDITEPLKKTKAKTLETMQKLADTALKEIEDGSI